MARRGAGRDGPQRRPPGHHPVPGHGKPAPHAAPSRRPDPVPGGFAGDGCRSRPASCEAEGDLTMYVEQLGEHGPRLLLVHGGIVPGWQTWEAQRPLASQYRLVVPHRPGYPPNPPGEGSDLEPPSQAIADLIEPGTDVVGHSYGGVASLLAATLVPERVRSLTVIEPPALGLVRGQPVVEDLISRLEPIYGDRSMSAREFVLRFA